MTIEEKAKAYDEAIEALRGLLDGIHEEKCDIMEEDITNIFPELKESENERWRNWLIGHLKGYINQTCNEYAEVCKKAIAWLEKQSEQKKTAIEAWKDMRFEVYQQASGNRHEPNYSDDTTKMFSLNDIDEIFEKISDCVVEQKPIKCIMNEALSKLLSKVVCRFINNPDIPYSERNEVSVKLIPYIEMLEKQCEQKPQGKSALEAAKEEKVDNADKVEPKFKVGDRVKIHCNANRDCAEIYNGKIGRIREIWDLERNKWGNICVTLKNGCNNAFLESELELVENE